MNKVAIQHQKAVALARERYERLGYRVVEDPGSADLPPFLEGIAPRPDLLVERGGEHLLVEVKTARSAPRNWSELYDRLKGHPDWGLIFMVAESEQGAESGRIPSADDIRSRLERPPPDETIAALLYTWALFEAAARRQLLRAGDEPHPVASTRIISRLIHLGILDQTDFAPLATLASKRNAAAHGSLDEVVTLQDVQALRAIAFRLLSDDPPPIEAAR